MRHYFESIKSHPKKIAEALDRLDLRLSKDELSDKWIKGILSKQIDANCNVVRKENPLKKGKNSKMLKEILNCSKNEKY